MERAANVLVDLSWLFPVHQQGATGRPRDRYRVNLKIYKWAAGGTDETDGTTSDADDAGIGTPPQPDETDETPSGPAADEEEL
ncbi:MAG: hypothetical protein IPJ19_15270 [Planctomycetes bacterium]|nr:hypothetical protein [Planctomycetota bacterium]